MLFFPELAGGGLRMMPPLCRALTRRGTPCPYRASRLHTYNLFPVCGHHVTALRMQLQPANLFVLPPPGAAAPAEEGGQEDEKAQVRPDYREAVGRCAAQTQRGYRCRNRGKVIRRGAEVCGVHAVCTNLVLFGARVLAPPVPAVFEDQEENCRICFEPLARVRVTTLPCGHRFCRHCARNHRRVSGRNHRCPMCRVSVR